MKNYLMVIAACAVLDNTAEPIPYFDFWKPCLRTPTTASGIYSPGRFCSGDLIFNEDFHYLDLEKWQHEYYKDREFQWYVNSRSNSFVQNGNLHIRPSVLDEPPFITSARIRTKDSFRFLYGRVEVRAKMPAGDWLFPAIWLMPAKNTYGSWPTSGEIDLVECRGNRHLTLNGVNIGVEQAGFTLHYGPSRDMNGWRKATWSMASKRGYNKKFHRYQLEWTPDVHKYIEMIKDYLAFGIDDMRVGGIAPGTGGFWEHGEFGRNRSTKNLWRLGTHMAPFDKEFYLIINLAVGGMNYFPDAAVNPMSKPWTNHNSTKKAYGMEQAKLDFWIKRSSWLPTWNVNSDDSHLQVDYVRVWAL